MSQVIAPKTARCTDEVSGRLACYSLYR